MSADERQVTRLTYLAYGEMPDDLRAVVHERCARFHAALQADRTPEEAAMAFPANAREPAARAAVAIRAFEAAIGQKTGAPPWHIYRPQTQPWYPRPTDGRYTYTVSSFCVGFQDHSPDRRRPRTPRSVRPRRSRIFWWRSAPPRS
jgi:hypothetical protein